MHFPMLDNTPAAIVRLLHGVSGPLDLHTEHETNASARITAFGTTASMDERQGRWANKVAGQLSRRDTPFAPSNEVDKTLALQQRRQQRFTRGLHRSAVAPARSAIPPVGSSGAVLTPKKDGRVAGVRVQSEHGMLNAAATEIDEDEGALSNLLLRVNFQGASIAAHTLMEPIGLFGSVRLL